MNLKATQPQIGLRAAVYIVLMVTESDEYSSESDR